MLDINKLKEGDEIEFGIDVIKKVYCKLVYEHESPCVMFTDKSFVRYDDKIWKIASIVRSEKTIIWERDETDIDGALIGSVPDDKNLRFRIHELSDGRYRLFECTDFNSEISARVWAETRVNS
jgi:hypothetical protein